jgi:hypothetical protein
MIELNLLPEVKLEYIKAQRMRRLTVSVSIIVSIVAVALLVFLLSVGALQKKHLKDLSNDISSESSQLKGKPQISKILTVQNQLESLTALHAAKPAAGNLFEYLNQITPTDISISSFHVDFTTQTMTVTGSTDSLSSVNKYVDTLKYTTYKSVETGSAKAFGNVVMSSFGISTATAGTANDKPASYSITLSYDPKIFDITQQVKLDVPSLTTTRASIDQSTSDLFQASGTTATPAPAPTPTPGSN